MVLSVPKIKLIKFCNCTVIYNSRHWGIGLQEVKNSSPDISIFHQQEVILPPLTLFQTGWNPILVSFCTIEFIVRVQKRHTEQCLRNQLRTQKRRKSYGFLQCTGGTHQIQPKNILHLIAVETNDPLNVPEDTCPTF